MVESVGSRVALAAKVVPAGLDKSPGSELFEHLLDSWLLKAFSSLGSFRLHHDIQLYL